MGRLGLEYREISFKRQYRGEKKPRELYADEGFDTETEEGNVRIMANSQEYIEPKDFSEAINFLCESKNQQKTNWFYNIHYDVQAIFKMHLPTARSLFMCGEAAYGNYRFKYIPKKALAISHGNKSYKFFDAFQYYKSSLKNASEKYLGIRASGMKEDRGVLFGKYSREEIGRYCQHDAWLTRLLGENLKSTLSGYGINTNSPYSCANISQEAVLSSCDVPTMYDAPKAANRMAYYAYRGGWFDCYKKGLIEEACAYDIVSAYPATIRDLPDIRQGHWEYGYNPKEFMGFAYAIIKNKRSLIYGLPLSIKAFGTNIYPFFDEKGIAALTYQECRSLSGEYDLQILDALTFYPDERCQKPFEGFIDRVFHEKSISQGYRREVNKIIMNSLYGKMAQLLRKNGAYETSTLTNFIYASHITAGTRCMIFDTLKRHNLANNVVQILTDGVIFDRNVRLPTGKGLGEWDLKAYDAKCLSIGSGIYSFMEKDRITTATRGIPRSTNLWEFCNKPERDLHIMINRPQGAKECIRQKREGDIAKFVDTHKELHINGEIKRLYPPIAHASDLLQHPYPSTPIPFSAINSRRRE